MEGKSTKPAPFTTEDLGLAAYLYNKKMKVLSTIPTHDKRRYAFVFIDQPERKKLVDEYFSGQGKVSAINYFYNIKDVRNLLKEPFIPGGTK